MNGIIKVLNILVFRWYFDMKLISYISINQIK